MSQRRQRELTGRRARSLLRGRSADFPVRSSVPEAAGAEMRSQFANASACGLERPGSEPLLDWGFSGRAPPKPATRRTELVLRVDRNNLWCMFINLFNRPYRKNRGALQLKHESFALVRLVGRMPPSGLVIRWRTSGTCRYRLRGKKQAGFDGTRCFRVKTRYSLTRENIIERAHGRRPARTN